MWWCAVIFVIVFVLVAVLLEFKTSRSDGTLVPVVHPMRKLMPYVMITRNESVVYFDSYVDYTEMERYLEQAREKIGANLTHCVVAACARGHAENPTMNQFVSGRRLYRRKGIWVTFTMKRKKLDKKADLATVKMRLMDDDTFATWCERVNGHINHQRSGKKTYNDKEYQLFNMVPRPILLIANHFLRVLDFYNVLPADFIEKDAMYASTFVANLGSVKMGAGYHHLYEWGNCPLFLMVGQMEERPVVVDGELAVKKILHLRYTYDERIDDGLSARFGIDTVKRVLENPFEELGCLAEDGSDAPILAKVD
ncbi:MAG: hypothetical protein HN348_02785 [Proteobacteria bacterium]|nr:hypothetical protein [Pseudomonadota bacterium]